MLWQRLAGRSASSEDAGGVDYAERCPCRRCCIRNTACGNPQAVFGLSAMDLESSTADLQTLPSLFEQAPLDFLVGRSAVLRHEPPYVALRIAHSSLGLFSQAGTW
jgi:hypothetical protein